MGIIQSQKNLTQAEKHFKAALKLGLSMNHDLAMAKMSLSRDLPSKKKKARSATTINRS
jgi:hypothetical protein